ncbi:hypothetical protein [Cohnella silvisoli]|uniref:AsmA family protein n=1 Tax=Cohnella silvisoli TaxID=2873699 RepID=A0ABV1L496_9BACL|nr:hypothetical protein [Cohnella silvisoli]MCD9026403.1 hypothetical protein [Cohnella silvisoli]
MSPIRIRYIKIIGVVAVLAFTLAASALLLLPKPSQTSPLPAAVHGELDLTRWDFRQQGSVKLSGEWEFYEAVP